MRTAFALGLAVFVAPSIAHAYGEPDGDFPNWQERVVVEWANRARSDPQVEMQACGSSCPEGACYVPGAPAYLDPNLSKAARFHSDEMANQSYFAHDSHCTVVSNIADLYPASCNGAASCACVGGVSSCNPTCTAWYERIGLFGASASGEIIASSTDPNSAFYQWLFEPYDKTTCGYDQGPPTNGHRYNLLMAGPGMGVGIGQGPAVGDFGGSPPTYQIPSGSHYPRQADPVDAWVNWYDAAGPSQALIDVDGTCTPLALERGAPTNGAYHLAVTGVGSGCHRYFFTFKDGAGNVVDYPTTGSLGIGPEGSCADWDATRPALGAGCDCTPSCDGVMCGDDGCGGSCSPCGDNETCVAGQCVLGGTGGGGGVGGQAASGGSTASSGASSSNGGGSNATGGGNATGGAGSADDGGDSGCGCRLERGRSEQRGATALALLFGAAALGRRRRRAAR